MSEQFDIEYLQRSRENAEARLEAADEHLERSQKELGVRANGFGFARVLDPEPSEIETPPELTRLRPGRLKVTNDQGMEYSPWSKPKLEPRKPSEQYINTDGRKSRSKKQKPSP